MKIRVGCDERFPDFYISTSSTDREIEVTEDEYKFIVSAIEMYEKAQTILGHVIVKKVA
jgi:hypothetical protein